jgi:hypothetical protein
VIERVIDGFGRRSCGVKVCWKWKVGGGERKAYVDVRTSAEGSLRFQEWRATQPSGSAVNQSG